MVACARFSAIARAVCPCRFQSQARRLDVPPPKSTPAPERHCTASSSYLITRSLTSHILSPSTWVKRTTGISFTCSCQHLLARGGRSRRYVSHPACAVQRARAFLKAAAQGDKIESLQSFQIFVHDDFTTHIGMLASGHFAAYTTAGISLPKSNT